MKPVNKQFDGLALCTRYAFMPNKLQYCGGTKDNQLFEYGIRGGSDPFLQSILAEFETMYPYLKLIAENNKIQNIFDYRVVEAYWLGNELLQNSNMNKFYWHLIDNLKLKKKVKLNEFCQIIDKLPRGMLSHHNFHVANIWIKTGHQAITQALTTMDKCRISWGKVTAVKNFQLQVLSPVLAYQNNRLVLTEPHRIVVNYKFNDKGFVVPQINDWISIHWDWACDIITEKQKNALAFYTQKSLNLANSSVNKN